MGDPDVFVVAKLHEFCRASGHAMCNRPRDRPREAGDVFAADKDELSVGVVVAADTSPCKGTKGAGFAVLGRETRVAGFANRRSSSSYVDSKFY